MGAGRPKAEKIKEKVFTMRVTNEEFAEICKVAEKLKISKAEAVMRGIREIAKPQQVYYRSQMPNFKPKKIQKNSNSEAVIEGETIMY